MALTTLTTDVAYISKLDNEPSDDVGRTPATLKAEFDKGSVAIKTFINDTLIPELNIAIGDKLSNTEMSTAIAAAVELALTDALSSGDFDGADGRAIELQNSGTYIQWRFAGDSTWTNLIALSTLKGDTGTGIVSIARTSGDGSAGTTDTYTITYSDDSTTTYEVKNGENGADGESGVTIPATGLFGLNVDETGHLKLYYTGDTAPNLSINESGHLIFNYDGSNTIDLGSVITASTASGISIADTGEHFTATDVEGALAELFTSVSNGKTSLAAAITDKGVSTAASDSFTTMASNIAAISSGGEIDAVIFANLTVGSVTTL